MLDNSRDLTVWLIWLAVLPFIYFTANLWIDPELTPRHILGEITWASVVLAFMGGCWWQRAINIAGRSLWTLYGLVPLLLGFAAQMVATIPALWVLTFSFILVFIGEIRTMRSNPETSNHLAFACLVAALTLQIMLWKLKLTGLYA